MRFSDEEFAKLKKQLFLYEWGQRTLLTKLGIIQEDLKVFHKNNPIEYIKGRIKAPESIANKLYNLGHEITSENAKKYLYDIAGVRIICSFSKDVYYIIQLLHAMSDVKILKEKDYITKPKPSGYRSYHIIMEVPVYYSEVTEYITVEVQIRTEAMNFWASLEHKAKYKFKEYMPSPLSQDLITCADKIAELDARMYNIYELIAMVNE